jgi:hypothetical protein
MSDFDPARPLILTKFKTIHGFRPHVGQPLTIVDEPAKEGDVTEAMARRLHKSGIAVYAEDFRPTPVETPEQEAARLVAERDSAIEEGEDAADVPLSSIPDDLNVTNSKLREIAAAEGVDVESDDNKSELQRKIVEHRAAHAPDPSAAADVPVIGE